MIMTYNCLRYICYLRLTYFPSYLNRKRIWKSYHNLKKIYENILFIMNVVCTLFSVSVFSFFKVSVDSNKTFHSVWFEWLKSEVINLKKHFHFSVSKDFQIEFCSWNLSDFCQIDFLDNIVKVSLEWHHIYKWMV